jgi:hypothetical protein
VKQRLLAVLFAGAALGGCATFSPPDVAVTGLAPLESTLFEPRMRLDLRLTNTGTRDLYIRGANVAFFVNDVELARGVTSSAFLVPTLGEARTSVEVASSLFRVAELLLALPGRETFTYELRGNLRLSGFPRSLTLKRSGSVRRDDLERLLGTPEQGPGVLRLE